jgi:hypothetical protein
VQLAVERNIQLCMLPACCIAGTAGEDLGEGGASNEMLQIESCLVAVGSVRYFSARPSNLADLDLQRKWKGPLQYQDKETKSLMMLPTDSAHVV